jgi:putative Mg2+ transporter-C (MgtC) family protein
VNHPAIGTGSAGNTSANGPLSSDEADLDENVAHGASKRFVTVTLDVQGTRSVVKLAAKLVEIDGVVSVHAGDVNVPSD